MTLVPRVLEARGLDVTPGMMVRLRKIGDIETVAILEVILREEVNHVAIGTRWFQYLCAQRRLDATQTFRTLLAEHRSEEHTSELQSLMRISYAVFCLKKKKQFEETRQSNVKHTNSIVRHVPKRQRN